MKPIGLLRSSLSVAHVSRYALESLENAVAAHGCGTERPAATSRSAGRLLKFLYKAGLLRSPKREHERALIVPMMGLQEALLFPWAFHHEVIPVVFDCMPHQFGDWLTLFRRTGVDKAFFTASMVAEHFRTALPGGEWIWLPEAIDRDAYTATTPWAERGIQVLEFGRRFTKYHQAVVGGLRRENVSHVYEKAQGELVFRTRADFIEGLASTKLSICFPQSLTHPERFGHIETLTQRYLESMASGALIVGESPAELRTLFGYDPVIQVDWDDPVNQALALIAEPGRHAELRARNLESVKAVGLWDSRSMQLILRLREMGYAISHELDAPGSDAMLSANE